MKKVICIFCSFIISSCSYINEGDVRKSAISVDEFFLSTQQKHLLDPRSPAPTNNIGEEIQISQEINEISIDIDDVTSQSEIIDEADIQSLIDSIFVE